MGRGTDATMMDTDDVSARDRIPFWNDWINSLFQGLQSDLYGDTEFDGRLASAHAGDVIRTRLESNRHRVMRARTQVRGSELGYLQIVAPLYGRAGAAQQGRDARVALGDGGIYDHG